VPSVSVSTRSPTTSYSLAVAAGVYATVSSTDTGPAVSAVLLYVSDGSATGTSTSQSTSHVPWLPTTAFATVPTAWSLTVHVSVTVYVPATVPAGSVPASGFALLQVNGA